MSENERLVSLVWSLVSASATLAAAWSQWNQGLNVFTARKGHQGVYFSEGTRQRYGLVLLVAFEVEVALLVYGGSKIGGEGKGRLD